MPRMTDPGRKLERSVLTLVLISLGALVLLIAGSIAGYRGYSGFQERRALRRAEGYLAGGDYRLASLSARRAEELNGNDPAAARMMAKIGERIGDRNALDWRRKVVQLRPSSSDDQIALAQCALQFKEIDLAGRALAAVPEADRSRADYAAATAQLEQARDHKAEAEEHWSRAAELAPDNAEYQLQLAGSRLALDDAAKRQSGVAILEKLRTNPEHRAAAIRLLIDHKISRQENAGDIRQLAQELQALPNAPFADRLLYLEILRQLNDPEYIAYLTETEKQAAERPVELAALISWMTRNHLRTLAVDYARTVSPEMAAKWPVPLPLCEAYAGLDDWDDVVRAAATADWKEYDFLRQAYLARAYRGLGDAVKADRSWTLAQKIAAEDPQHLLVLAQTVAEWQWDKETDALLWELSRQASTQFDALHTLYSRYTRATDSAGLYRVLARLTELKPDDSALQNNFAQVALMLKVDLDRAYKIARNLHEKEPANAAFASTYSFALLRQGKTEQAVAALAALPEEQLRDPAIALYYGVALAAAGDLDKAGPYLQLASGAKMFGEEKQLYDEALTRLSRR